MVALVPVTEPGLRCSATFWEPRAQMGPQVLLVTSISHLFACLGLCDPVVIVKKALSTCVPKTSASLCFRPTSFPTGDVRALATNNLP